MTEPQVPIGAFVAGLHGEPLGQVAAVYVDNATGRAAWAAVQSGRHAAVVPLEFSRFDGVTLHVPFDSERLRTAPVHDPSTLISYEEGDELARHYGLLPADPPHPVDQATDEPDPPAGAPSDVVVTRSEEQLRAGAVNVVVGRARLVTYVVTEDQTFTIPVRRQEVRLVYDAVPPDEQVVSDTAPAADVHEIVRYAEQVFFSTQVVPVERIRMVRRVVTGERTVTAELASEQIDIDRIGPDDSGPGRLDHTSNGQVSPGRHHDHQET